MDKGKEIKTERKGERETEKSRFKEKNISGNDDSKSNDI